MNTIQIKVLKTFVHTLGRLSDGVRIAHEHGFTSGKMVDYVYRNQPSGIGPLGKLFDRIYLSNAGWQAVRIRRRHVEELLEWAIRRQLDRVGNVLVVDVASGPARYLRDVLLKFVGRRVEAVCWDLDEKWLEESQDAAAELGLRSILYERGDAMDAESFARLPRWPHVVIASGFYEWIADDEAVKRSLQIVHDALGPGGYFLLTLQTGHVDLEMTNEVFSGFDGGPLQITVRRAEMVHRWARRAGFVIERTRSDPGGYHAVTLARKR